MKHSPKSKTKPKPKPASTPVHEWSFEAIGTQWWVGIYQALSDAKIVALKSAIAVTIEQFDATYSRFRADSLVTRIAHEAGVYALPADSGKLFDMYRKLYDVTDGAVTPLIGQALSDAGYDASYSLQPGQLRRPLTWDEALSFRDGMLVTKQAVLLDFGAAGKGYLVDIVGQILQLHGVTQYCVDASGDMAYMHPTEVLRVGLEHPKDPSQIIGFAELRGGALCGSAGNRRAWAGYHHIMDPFSLESPRDILALWVVADDALLADGLTTALFFAPPEKLLQQFQFAYVIMYADESVVVSPDFPGQVFAIQHEEGVA